MGLQSWNRDLHIKDNKRMGVKSVPYQTDQRKKMEQETSLLGATVNAYSGNFNSENFTKYFTKLFLVFFIIE